ncbi:PEP-CTERM sorting domain-containing protein [Pelagicoccus sp. NFK12]|uniref:PEP-CTERM sorting domain-containing protein n=1 Tax=Pelagicoccus enzymogenes TaxID=2773457 RepID=A0A927F714_9BACT|nr:PEP-CTERM sorting domain-containing protein [Pelagicoccus enzymogenes]
MSYDVYAKDNSSNGGTPVNTISLSAGQAFTTNASLDDLWSAGANPRWSNADGLLGNLFATGTDDSGASVGTLIGQAFGPYNDDGFSAPYGALVGKIGSSYILLGTSFAGVAPEAGVLQLMYWDSNAYDNTEYITVEVNAVPDAGGIALSLMGIAALVGFRRFSRR